MTARTLIRCDDCGRDYPPEWLMGDAEHAVCRQCIRERQFQTQSLLDKAREQGVIELGEDTR